MTCLSGCDDDNAAFLTTTTTMPTTAHRFQYLVSRTYDFPGGGRGDACRSHDYPFVSGESFNLSEEDSCLGDVLCGSGTHVGSCGILTLSGTLNNSHVGVVLRPFDSHLCGDEEIERTMTMGTLTRMCTLKRENLTCTTPNSAAAPNVWDPELHMTSSMRFCSDMNPRRRCTPSGSRCWYVPETPACPSEPDQCALDPTCSCGAGMIKTTVLSSTYSENITSFPFDVGAWCWRCEPQAQLACEDSRLSVSSPDECTWHSNCNCPESGDWLRPVVKHTFYTDANRTKMVPKSTIGALKCFTCDNLLYNMVENMTISTELDIVVSSRFSSEIIPSLPR